MRKIFRVEAENEEDAREVAEDHIKGHYGIQWFTIHGIKEYKKPTCGKVVIP